jgi:Baseplate J-like protein
LKNDIKIDGRSSEKILSQVKAIAPYYTPLLDTFDEKDQGVVLLKIFSSMVEDVIKRLDQVPEKNFIAFLDMLGMGLQPPRPSRVPLTFTVSEGANKEIYIPERTLVGADATKTRPEMIFEVEPGKGFLATSSVLKKVYSVNPKKDEIFEHLGVLEKGSSAELFTDSGQNLQEHIFYIGHSDLFNIKGEARIELKIEPAKLSAILNALANIKNVNPSVVRWEYYGEKIEVTKDGEEIKKEGWHALSFEVSGPTVGEPSGVMDIVDNRPVILIRGVGDTFEKRLKKQGITTIEELLNFTPDELVQKLATSLPRAAKVLEAAKKEFLDYYWRKYYKDYKEHKKRLPEKLRSEHPLSPGTTVPSLASEPPDGSIVLWKVEGGEIKEHEINKIKSRWIRCRIEKFNSLDDSKLGKIKEILSLEKGSTVGNVIVKISKTSISSVEVGMQPYDEDGNQLPNMAFYNDVPLDLTLDENTGNLKNDLYPFGEIPSIYNSFYIASHDAFSKKGADITITFTISEGKPSDNLRLSWEYWNGEGWTVIEGLTDNTNKFTAGDDDKTITVTFTCPNDFEMTGIGGHENYWVRVRIVAGDYGKVKFVETDGTIKSKTKLSYLKDDGSVEDVKNMLLETDGIWQRDTESIKAPEFTKLSIAYKEPGRIPEHIITHNNLDYSGDFIKEGLFKRFRPFKSLKEKTQSLYLGFDSRLKSGPINIFFSLEEREYPEGFIPRFRWEYYSGGGPLEGNWAKLDVIDETGNLTKRGILSLVAPDGMSTSRRFGEELYWIRARLTGGQFEPEIKDNDEEEVETKRENAGVDIDQELQPCEKTLSIDCADEKVARHPPSLKGIHLNTTWALQTETLMEEILGSSDGTPEQKYVFSKRPVINEEVRVNELSSLSSGERRELMKKTPLAVSEVKDVDGNTTEFWVKWGRVDDFLNSKHEDRHYVLDRTMGTVNVGDGINGRVPPIGRDNIKANYQTGGGMAGNIKAGEAASLKSSLPFIDGVTNPELADGGADTEALDELLMRGPQHIKNRGHAVMREDFEWIALEASRKIARAKCIPGLDKECNFKPGWVTLIIVPQSSEKRPVPSVGLKGLVMKYVEERSAGALIVPKRLVVKGPGYLGVSISATLIARSIDRIPRIEKEAQLKVRKFLHPLTGGDMGGGWEFGRLPCLSDFYQILEGIDGVDHVKGLGMEIKGAKKDEKIVITPESEFYPQLKQYNLVFSGEHDITATIRGV